MRLKRNILQLERKSTKPFRGIESQSSKRAILDCEIQYFIIANYARSTVRSNMGELYIDLIKFR